MKIQYNTHASVPLPILVKRIATILDCPVAITGVPEPMVTPVDTTMVAFPPAEVTKHRIASPTTAEGKAATSRAAVGNAKLTLPVLLQAMIGRPEVRALAAMVVVTAVTVDLYCGTEADFTELTLISVVLEGYCPRSVATDMFDGSGLISKNKIFFILKISRSEFH